MIELTIRVLKPIFVPLLKLKTDPPHLPEGTALVRSLKPSEAWFTWRALTALFGLLGQVIGTGVAAIAVVAKLGAWGWLIAALLLLVEAVVVGFTLVAVRVDWELRSFLVGDRSLRVSEGALTRREVTLSYANVQNLTVTTAGADQQPGLEHSHSVTLVGLDDAEAVRTLILGMLGKARDSGLGEQPPTTPEALPLARLLEVRDAALALRRAAGA